VERMTEAPDDETTRAAELVQETLKRFDEA
jgi:hypothetical protein